jgi:predicted SAM-dependent methyltransferase
MKVLEIGPNIRPQAHVIWPDAEIVTIDALEELKPDIVHDVRTMPEDLFGQFDGLLASHVLEHFHWHKTVYILAEWAKVLKEGGELHIVVPSLEWACRQILSEQPSPAALPHLFGGQTNEFDVHFTGFTMRKLRADFAKAGLKVEIARSGEYTIRIGDDETKAMQHYVMGRKPITPQERA